MLSSLILMYIVNKEPQTFLVLVYWWWFMPFIIVFRVLLFIIVVLPLLPQLLLSGNPLFVLTLCYSTLHFFCLINLFCLLLTLPPPLSGTFITLHPLIVLCFLPVPWAVHRSLSLFLLAPITTINPEMRYSILISSCFLAICHPLKVQTALWKISW